MTSKVKVINRKKETNNIKSHSCNICDFKCQDIKVLQEHQKEHQEEEEHYIKNEKLCLDVEEQKQENKKNKKQKEEPKLKEEPKPKEELKEKTKEDKEAILLAYLNTVEDNEIKLMFENHRGHSQLFYDYKISHLKITDLQNGTGYYFSNSSLLWKYTTNDYFIKEVMLFLESYIKDKIDLYSQAENKSKTIENYMRSILKTVQTTQHCTSVWKIAKSLFYEPEFEMKLNNCSHMLPLRKGRIINLTTLQTRYRNDKDFFSFELNVDYLDKLNSFINAEKFLNQLMKDDKDKSKYLQELLGYCMTGETSDRSIYILYGCGKNGKSTLINIMNLILLNRFCIPISDQVVTLGKNNSSHTAFIVPLITARVGIKSESEDGEELHSKLIKQLTGDDLISYRALFKEESQFKNKCKILLLTNKKPTFDINDQAMLDRIKYIPFSARFVPNPKEGEYKEDGKFIRDLETIYLDEFFTYLCHGAKRFYDNQKIQKGLIVPKCLKDATDKYIDEINSVSQFITDKCIINKEAITKASTIYEEYLFWQKEEKKGKSLSQPDFYKQIINMGYEKKKDRKTNINCIFGLSLIPDN